MSIRAFFIRFTLVYFLVMAATDIGLSLTGLENSSSLNMGILVGLAYWFFNSYSVKNGRCSGLIAPDTEMRDNTINHFRCHNERK